MARASKLVKRPTAGSEGSHRRELRTQRGEPVRLSHPGSTERRKDHGRERGGLDALVVQGSAGFVTAGPVEFGVAVRYCRQLTKVRVYHNGVFVEVASPEKLKSRTYSRAIPRRHGYFAEVDHSFRAMSITRTG